MPIVDIIIRSKNGRELLEKALVSIDRHTHADKYRLIVVDDGSDEALVSQTSGVVDYVVRCDKSHGAVTATNLGLSVSLLHHDSPYVLVADNDIEVPNGDVGWLDRFVREIEDEGETCAAIGATTGMANPPQHILAVPQTYIGNWKSTNGKCGSAENPPAPWFVSFCVLIRKSAIRQCGLWDERFNPGNWEDTDYAVRLRIAGYTVKVARSVYIHHAGHKTFSDDLQRLLQANYVKMVDKWGIGRLGDLGIVQPDTVARVFGEAAR